MRRDWGLLSDPLPLPVPHVLSFPAPSRIPARAGEQVSDHESLKHLLPRGRRCVAPISWCGFLQFTPPVCQSQSLTARRSLSWNLTSVPAVCLLPWHWPGSFTETHTAWGPPPESQLPLSCGGDGACVCLGTVCCLLAMIRGEAFPVPERAGSDTVLSPSEEKVGFVWSSRLVKR